MPSSAAAIGLITMLMKSGANVKRGPSGSNVCVPWELVSLQSLAVSRTGGRLSVTVNVRVTAQPSSTIRGDSVIAVTTGVAVQEIKYAKKVFSISDLA